MSPRPKNPSGPPRPTTAKRPVLEGMVGAGLLHAAFVAGALVTFQHSFDLTDQTHAVPVDLITIADKTNVQAMVPPQPEPPKVDVPLPDVPVPPEPDMVKAGVITPTKVERSALQNAASVATLLLTTDAIIVEKPKPAGAGAGGPPGGGMEGMGGMGGMGGGMGGMGGMGMM